MAIYKPSYCYPFLNAVDLYTYDDVKFLQCKVNSSNKNVTGYRLYLMDSNGQEIWCGDQISPISELSNSGIDITSTYLTNTGVNGSYLQIPFIYPNRLINSLKSKSFNCLYSLVEYSADYYVILDTDTPNDALDSSRMYTMLYDYLTDINSSLEDDQKYTYIPYDTLLIKLSSGAVALYIVKESSITGNITLELKETINDLSYIRINKNSYDYNNSLRPLQDNALLYYDNSTTDKLINKNSGFLKYFYMEYNDSQYLMQSKSIEYEFKATQQYSWYIRLYQGEYTQDSSYNFLTYNDKLREFNYDMIMGSGNILGSTGKRIQVYPSEKIVQNYFVQLGTYDSDKQNFTQYGTRGVITNYDSAYGHIYPEDGYFNENIFESNPKINACEIFKYSNNPDEITAQDTVAYATVETDCDTELRLCLFDDDHSSHSIDGITPVEGDLVLIKDFTGNSACLNGVYVVHTASRWARSGSYNQWSDFIGKVIFVSGGITNRQRNFISPLFTGGTLATDEVEYNVHAINELSDENKGLITNKVKSTLEGYTDYYSFTMSDATFYEYSDGSKTSPINWSDMENKKLYAFYSGYESSFIITIKKAIGSTIIYEQVYSALSENFLIYDSTPSIIYKKTTSSTNSDTSSSTTSWTTSLSYFDQSTWGTPLYFKEESPINIYPNLDYLDGKFGRDNHNDYGFLDINILYNGLVESEDDIYEMPSSIDGYTNSSLIGHKIGFIAKSEQTATADDYTFWIGTGAISGEKYIFADPVEYNTYNIYMINVEAGTEYGNCTMQFKKGNNVNPAVAFKENRIAMINKNHDNVLYIKPNTELKTDCLLFFNEVDISSQVINQVDDILWSVTLSDITFPSGSDTFTTYSSVTNEYNKTPYKYQIKSFYNTSDENPILFYNDSYIDFIPLKEYESFDVLATPEPIQITDEDSVYSVDVNKQIVIKSRYVRLRGRYTQFQKKQWESYKFLLSNKYGEVIQRSDKIYSGDFHIDFYGLNDTTDNLYYVIVLVEDEIGNTEYGAIKILFSDQTQKSTTFSFNTAPNIRLQTIDMLIKEDILTGGPCKIEDSQAKLISTGTITSNTAYALSDNSMIYTTGDKTVSLTHPDGLYNEGNLYIPYQQIGPNDLKNVAGNATQVGLDYRHFFADGQTISCATNEQNITLDIGENEKLYFATCIQPSDNYCGELLRLNYEGYSDTVKNNLIEGSIALVIPEPYFTSNGKISELNSNRNNIQFIIYKEDSKIILSNYLYSDNSGGENYYEWFEKNSDLLSDSYITNRIQTDANLDEIFETSNKYECYQLSDCIDSSGNSKGEYYSFYIEGKYLGLENLDDQVTTDCMLSAESDKVSYSTWDETKKLSSVVRGSTSFITKQEQESEWDDSNYWVEADDGIGMTEVTVCTAHSNAKWLGKKLYININIFDIDALTSSNSGDLTCNSYNPGSGMSGTEIKKGSDTVAKIKIIVKS